MGICVLIEGPVYERCNSQPSLTSVGVIFVGLPFVSLYAVASINSHFSFSAVRVAIDG